MYIRGLLTTVDGYFFMHNPPPPPCGQSQGQIAGLCFNDASSISTDIFA